MVKVMEPKLIGLLVLAVVVIVVIIGIAVSWKKEGYAPLYYNKGMDGNILSRGKFHANLDPTNPSLISDPNVYGGYIKGISPMVGDLAATNQEARSFALNGAKPRVSLSDERNLIRNGRLSAGVNDAAQYVNTRASQKESFQLINEQGQVPGQGEYEKMNTDFAAAVSEKKMQAAKKSAYMKNNQNINPELLEYTVPSELLPAPDMRAPMERDPSDPANFMYDRTLFAPLKARNHNTPDRVRGDIDIAPIKTGWFDSASIPQVDLAKGYMGYFNDIQETMDIQDIAFSRERDQKLEKKQGVLQADRKMNQIMSSMGESMMKPKLAYASPPPLDFGPLQNNYTDNDPWYNSNLKMSATPFSL